MLGLLLPLHLDLDNAPAAAPAVVARGVAKVLPPVVGKADVWPLAAKGQVGVRPLVVLGEASAQALARGVANVVPLTVRGATDVVR